MTPNQMPRATLSRHAVCPRLGGSVPSFEGAAQLTREVASLSFFCSAHDLLPGAINVGFFDGHAETAPLGATLATVLAPRLSAARENAQA